MARGTADIPTEGECYFCFGLCYDSDYCDGCNEFICEDCQPGADGSFFHSVEEHSGNDYD
jgi:hypothetical protein